jgi:Phospholipase_D-nuclease N-terminal
VLYLDGVAGLVVLALWLYCVLEVITTDEASVRNLSKMAWVVIVIFTFEIGAILWLIAGRPRVSQSSMPYKGNTGVVPPEYDRPGRATANNPDDDAEFLLKLRERAEAQRKKAAEQAKRLRQIEDEPPQS